jgi:hypothetical protein
VVLPATAPEEIVEEEEPIEMVPEQEAPMVHEVIFVDAASPSLSCTHEESPPRMMDDLDDLDDDPNEGCSDMDE